MGDCRVICDVRDVFATKPGPLMAGSNELRVTINGRGGHASQPHIAADPVPALASVVTALHTMVGRRFGVDDPVVLSVTQLQAGDALGVIPPSASLGATCRTLSAASVDRLIAETKTLADGIAEAHGCTADVSFRVIYPVTVNDAEETDAAVRTLRAFLGEETVQILAQPIMGSEDFSRVLDLIPGTFLFLGATPPESYPSTVWNHSPEVLFDDSVLAVQAAALAELAWARMTRE